MRKKMNASKDKRVFRQTAITKKKINLNPKTYRGGISL